MLLKYYQPTQPTTRTDYFFWLAQSFIFYNTSPQSEWWWQRWQVMRMLLELFLCCHNRRHQSDFFLSFFLINYLCWVGISSFPDRPTHWKWTLSYFLSHSLDETENSTNEVAETKKLDWLDLSELFHCLPKKGGGLNRQLTLGLISSHIALFEASCRLT